MQLAERLGDRTKTRVVRLEQADVPATLGLIEKLAAAFEVSLIEFLALILRDAAADELQRQVTETAAVERRRRLEDRVRLALAADDRPEVQPLVFTVTEVAAHMSDDELHWLLKDWTERLECRRLRASSDPILRHRGGLDDRPVYRPKDYAEIPGAELDEEGP